MLSLLQSAILGTVEGLTEFLPVSSSGHLILTRSLLGANTENGLAFDAIIQFGTIIAVFLYFRKDIWQLLRTTWFVITRHKERVPAHEVTLLYGIILGTIPAVILGLLLKKDMETIFRSPLLVAGALVAGSAFMWFAEHHLARAQRSQKTLSAHPTIKQSWWIGVYQTLALLPGFSRSGATISGGLLLGLDRETATRFSFLLSLPVIAGSGLLEMVSVAKHGASDFTTPGLVIGFVTAFVVGYFSIGWLLRYLKSHSLIPFAWYRVALAVVVLLVLGLH